ncbi:efflux RND transporter permease subunit [Haliangium ochraceum]|uniref:Acriflavin resistance protein n=1 Tax=Haliangium ochraceum (strain DSM 14365 / JCM 11303 / SMP-2) TaxID=502025 RepID=D0LJ50_HALO1|nr:efflux RND transporter permease subunit [Haliangium ochraceum]ACY14897.1 acriflavin resistance protein [Haliangium ochraceum DSM 14365]
MSLPGFSVKRPIFTAMVTLIVVTLGAVSLSRLRIDMLPAIEMPRLTVRTNYEGASPEVMERLVTQPLEEIVATVPGVEELTSESSEGSSNVRVTFAWGTDIDVAAQDVRSRLEDELNELPEDVTRPQIRKFDLASFPVVILGIGSGLDPVELTELIDLQVRYRFARIPGVAQVDMWGGYEREVRVELDPNKLRALELPLDAVLAAIADANIDLPAGEIDAGRYEVTLRAPAEFQNLEQIRQTVVAVRQGAPVTLGELAQIEDTYARLTRIVRVNGERGLRMAIRKQADANTVEVAHQVLAEIEAVNRDFPQLEVVPVINQGNFIEQSISNVARSVLYGGGLAVLVLLFFLRNLRSTMVISLAIPISVVATFALVYLGGFTLNLMTLGGLALGVGMMVDSSIVVLENIFRRREEMREEPAVAAVNGAREVGAAVLASTVTTLVIFLPLLFVRGVSGLLFRELAYVVGFSLICALAVSLSLVPMLASRFLRSAEDAHTPRHGRIARLAAAADAAITGLSDRYRALLERALERRALTILVAVGLTGLSFVLYPFIGSEFMPPTDEGEVRVTGEMEVGTRLDIVDRQSRIMEAIVYPAVPEAVASVVTVGSSGPRTDGAAEADIRLSLVPASQRTRSNTAVADDLRERLTGQMAGMELRVRAPQGQFLLERVLGGTGDALTVEVRGFELEVLEDLAQRAEEAMTQVAGITDVQSSRKPGLPQNLIRIDRAKAAQLGLSPRDLSEALETAVAGRRAGEYRPEGHSYQILVQLEDVHRLAMDEILDLTLETPSGDTVALRNLVEVESGRGPALVDRKDQQRVITIEGNVAGRDMGSVAEDVEALLLKIARPVGYDLMVTGAFEEQREATGELALSLLLAIILVYMVLACQYESLRDPLVVMLSVPAASFGVLLVLWLTQTTLNVQSYIGCIMLGGIVVNNAILLVDQAGQLRQDGLAAREAVLEAGRRRLRPVLMTTLTTILGLLPLAFGIGEGAEAQAPLARAVIGGLTGSTMITLVLIPVVYSLVHRERTPA